MTIVQVIVPVYNAEKTLKRCLDSLVNQTMTDWQAILIDDTSKDSSISIIEEYLKKDNRFIFVRNETNLGVSKTRNKAIELLNSSEYTAFLDSDDWWENDTLEVMVGAGKEYGADIVQCGFIYNFKNGKTFLPAKAFSKTTFLRRNEFKPIYIKMMTGINMNHVCTRITKTDIIKKYRFDTKLKTAEDLDFSVRSFKDVNTYLFLPRPLYHYYRSDEGLTGAGLSGKEKLYANKCVSKTMVCSLEDWNLDNMFYRIMAYSRSYILIVSKVFRVLREKIKTR